MLTVNCEGHHLRQARTNAIVGLAQIPPFVLPGNFEDVKRSILICLNTSLKDRVGSALQATQLATLWSSVQPLSAELVAKYSWTVFRSFEFWKEFLERRASNSLNGSPVSRSFKKRRSYQRVISLGFRINMIFYLFLYNIILSVRTELLNEIYLYCNAFSKRFIKQFLKIKGNPTDRGIKVNETSIF